MRDEIDFEKLLLSTEQAAEFSSPRFFQFIFGRKPNRKYDRQVLYKYLHSIAKSPTEILEEHLKAGLSESAIEAIYETGIAPTIEDYHLYPPALVGQWLAIALELQPLEPQQRVSRRLAPQISKHPYGRALTTLYLEISHFVVRASHFSDTTRMKAVGDPISSLFLYYLSRSIQLFRTVRVLINNDEASSLMYLCRGIYECYLSILFLNDHPNLAKNAILPALLHDPRYSWAIRNGRPIRTHIHDSETQKDILVHYKVSDKARLCHSSCGKFHDLLYRQLSADSHVTSELMGEFFDKDRFHIHYEQEHDLTLFMIGFCQLLLVNELARFEGLTSRERRDFRYGRSKVLSALLVIERLFRPAMAAKEDPNDEDERLLREMMNQIASMPKTT